MKDYNFFSTYVYTVKNKSIKRYVLPVFLILILVSVGLTYILLDRKENDLQSEYDTQELILNSQMYKETMDEVKVLRAHLAYLQMLNEETLAFDMLMIDSYKVSDELMSSILIATPQNVVYSNYAINRSKVEIFAVTNDYSYIAEFEINLRKLNIFENIVVNNIFVSDDLENGFTFSITLEFGGDLLE